MRTWKIATFTSLGLIWSALAPTSATTGVLPPRMAVEAVRRLQPALTPPEASKLVRAAIKASESCPVSWKVLVAIAFHESSLKSASVNSGSQDYGLVQINSKNFSRFRINKARVMTDPTYAFQAACKILAHNYENYSDYPYWLGIYRSGTALWKRDIRDNAKRYDRIIRRTAATLE